jgi:hypothetical protein
MIQSELPGFTNYKWWWFSWRRATIRICGSSLSANNDPTLDGVPVAAGGISGGKSFNYY